MAEETIPKKSGAERQAEILVAALERASQNGGVLLNSSQKLAPHFYDKPMRITPANALIMAMHSDQGEFKTNGYTMYNETHNRSEAVMKGQKGVPFNWYNWNEYQNKNNPEDKISREQYKALTHEQQGDYKGIRSREIRVLFNIERPRVTSSVYSSSLPTEIPLAITDTDTSCFSRRREI